ncbi:MAG: hypothetical protein DCC67_14935, partial [Planctomycetota bacterium]
LRGPYEHCILGSAEDVPLPDASRSVVYGEAMLSMQPQTVKERIVAEAARILRAGGRYGIHELCIVGDGASDDIRAAIAADLSDEIHVGVRPLAIAEWRRLLQDAGMSIVAQELAPMHLLEPRRVVADEGLWRAVRFAWNVARTPAARRRVLAMRRAFRKHADRLGAIMLVAAKG